VLLQAVKPVHDSHDVGRNADAVAPARRRTVSASKEGWGARHSPRHECQWVPLARLHIVAQVILWDQLQALAHAVHGPHVLLRDANDAVVVLHHAQGQVKLSQVCVSEYARHPWKVLPEIQRTSGVFKLILLCVELLLAHSSDKEVRQWLRIIILRRGWICRQRLTALVTAGFVRWIFARRFLLRGDYCLRFAFLVAAWCNSLSHDLLAVSMKHVSYRDLKINGFFFACTTLDSESGRSPLAILFFFLNVIYIAHESNSANTAK
jgi:hypothetical protein